MGTTVDDPRGEYSVESALAQPYLTEQMGAALVLAQSAKTMYPDYQPIITLRVEDWPPEISVPPALQPYRIVCVYDPGFAAFLVACETGSLDTIANARAAMAEKTATEMRERYWALTDEIQTAARSGDQKAVITLAAERDVLANILSGRGEKVGHSA